MWLWKSNLPQKNIYNTNSNSVQIMHLSHWDARGGQCLLHPSPLCQTNEPTAELFNYICQYCPGLACSAYCSHTLSTSLAAWCHRPTALLSFPTWILIRMTCEKPKRFLDTALRLVKSSTQNENAGVTETLTSCVLEMADQVQAKAENCRHPNCRWEGTYVRGDGEN